MNLTCENCEHEWDPTQAKYPGKCPKCGTLTPQAKAALVKKQALIEKKKAATKASVKTETSSDSPHEVIVTDIRMPFMSMVTFMVKWALASIPALAILIMVGMFAVYLTQKAAM